MQSKLTEKIIAAITIRNLPDPVHDALRQMAEACNMSVEGLVRNLLAKAVAQSEAGESKPTGIAEPPQTWSGAPTLTPPTGLWGALRGTVHIPPGTDLTAPTGALWEAAT
jgi:hypothetical protein